MVPERITFSNHGPASETSRAKFEREMTKLAPYARESIARTWRHEQDHKVNDPESRGEFGYQISLEITSLGTVFASWVAYYMPIGEREPEDLMRIAEGPGKGEMSNQDWKIYNSAWRQWRQNLEEEKRKSEAGNDQESEDPSDADRPIDKESVIQKIPTLIAIPRKKSDRDEDYDERVKWVRKVGDKLDELIGEGILEPIDEAENVIEYISKNLDVLKKVFTNILEKEKQEDKEVEKQTDEAGKNVDDKEEDEKNRQDLNDSIIGGTPSYWDLP